MKEYLGFSSGEDFKVVLLSTKLLYGLLICYKLYLTHTNYIIYLCLDRGLIVSIDTVALENL